MNANELNKWIENSPYTEQEGVIVLLRQQQAEIEALKATISELEYVMSFGGNDYEDLDKHGKDGLIPHYTHPVKEPLTDEDLMEIFYEMTALSKLHCEALTKAILRKAQENGCC